MPTIMTVKFEANISPTFFDLTNAQFDSVSFSVNSQEGTPLGFTFKPDGTRMYVVGQNSDSVHQYTLSTGFDISTASFDSVSFSVAGQNDNPGGVRFNSDGTKMFVVDLTTQAVYQYSLSTGFNLSTASFDNVSFDVSGQAGQPWNLVFNSNGTKMYIIGNSSNSVHQYSLSTGFDLSTASFDNVSFSLTGQSSNNGGLAFNPTGTKMFTTDFGNDVVHQYSLSTGFDLSTASFDNVSFDVSGQDGLPYDVTFSSDQTKMFIVGRSTASIYQYSQI